MEETQKSIGTTSCCFLKADISTLVRVGHFYFALTNRVFTLDRYPGFGYSAQAVMTDWGIVQW